MHALLCGRRHFERQPVSWRVAFKIVSGSTGQMSIDTGDARARGKCMQKRVYQQKRESWRASLAGLLQEQVSSLDAARDSGEVWPCDLSCLSLAQNPPLVSHFTRGKCQSPRKTLQDQTAESHIQDCSEHVHTHTHKHTLTPPRTTSYHNSHHLLLYPPVIPVFPEYTEFLPISGFSFNVLYASLSSLTGLFSSVALVTFRHTVRPAYVFVHVRLSSLGFKQEASWFCSLWSSQHLR